MKKFKENSYLLKSFCKYNKSQQNAIQKNLDKKQIKFIIELLGNIGCRNLKVDSQTEKKLKRHRKKINFLLSKKSINQKKPVLVNGNFLPALLKTLAKTLLPIAIEKLMNRNA